MSDKMRYFHIAPKNKDKTLVLAVKNDKICGKWVRALRTAQRYLEHSLFNKPVPAQEQVVEMFDDERNETTLYKRKVANPNEVPKRSSSIMNLRESDFEEFAKGYKASLKHNSGGKSTASSEEA